MPCLTPSRTRPAPAQLARYSVVPDVDSGTYAVWDRQGAGTSEAAFTPAATRRPTRPGAADGSTGPPASR